MFSYCITQDIWKNNDLNSHQEIMMTSQRRVKSLFTNSSRGLMRKQTIYIKKPVISFYFILETCPAINISNSSLLNCSNAHTPTLICKSNVSFHNFLMKERKKVAWFLKGLVKITDVFRKCKRNCVTGEFCKITTCADWTWWWCSTS